MKKDYEKLTEDGGNRCEYFCYKRRDNNDEIILIYCSHKDNKVQTDGNCIVDLCPTKHFQKVFNMGKC